MIYLDHNATTKIEPKVLEAMMPFLEDHYGNPASNHRFGRRAHTAIEAAREQVAAAVNAHPSQVIFTSSGSESNNLIIQGLASSNEQMHFAYSAIEHPCISRPIEQLKSRGYGATKINVTSNGMVDLDGMDQDTIDQINLLTCMIVNNETGVIQDMSKIIDFAHKNNMLVHSDAVQALGKMDVDFEQLGLDAMTISSHKIYGPQGVAALIINKKIDLNPLIYGGGQEKGLRSGTENLAAIVGFGKACEQTQDTQVHINAKIKPMQKFLEGELERMGATIFAKDSQRVANTTFFAINGIDGVTLLTAMDKHGFAMASGSACSSNNNEPSHVLRAMQVEEDLAQAAIRISLGLHNTMDEIKELVITLKKEVERLKQLTAMAA